MTSACGNTVWITQMKGAGMIYIILFHWFGLHLKGFWNMAANAGAQGNHIFFTLSAFGLYLSLSRKAPAAGFSAWRVWLWRRAKKLLLPYYISVAIVFSSIFFYGYATGDLAETLTRMHLNISTALSTVFLYRNFIGSHTTAINTPWWFAIAAMQFYLLFPFLYAIITKRGWMTLALGAFSINVLYISLYALVFKSTNNAFKCFPLQFVFSFSLGLVLCRIYLQNKEHFFKTFTGFKAISAGLLLEGIGVFLSFQGETGKSFNDLFFGPGIFLLTFNLVKILSGSNLASKGMEKIGEYSLPLFLLHAPYIYLIFPTKLPPGFLNGFFYFSVYVAFLFLLTWAVSKLIFEKIAMLREAREISAVDSKKNPAPCNSFLVQEEGLKA